MKKQLFFLTIGAMMSISFTGCSRIDKFMESQMYEKSGLYEDEGYRNYKKLDEEGKLDNEGYYQELTFMSDSARYAPIRVTFADNNNLEIQYYSDVDHKISIDKSACYINPGDSIYAHIEMKSDDISSMYNFSRFRVMDFNGEGIRKDAEAITINGEEQDYVISIPADYQGSEIAIEPIGDYKNRIISLKSYYTDDKDKNNKIDVDGIWTVNDKECKDNSIEINPVSSYIISYKYDNDEYFFLSSTPECFYSNNDDGVVIFAQRNADDETVDYEVELHKYISVTFVSDKDRSVWVNGDTEQRVKANNELTVSKLRYGDKITIETDMAWSELENSRDAILINTETLSNRHYKYTLTVPELDGKFLFDPSDYVYEHGTIAFKCFGETIKSPQILAKGSRIYYEQKSADDGYWLAGSNHYVEVTDESDTVRNLRQIHFTKKVQVKVSLPQPEYGGSIEYKLDGNKLYGDYCTTYSGSVISMKLTPWEGWIVEKVGELTYTVGNDKVQEAKAGSLSANSLFTEDEEHKPNLKVTLEKSVGENMVFTLSSSGYSMEASSYGGGWKVTDIISKNDETYNIIDNSQIIVEDKKIGTEKPIEITMSNKAIPSGKAVKMVVEMTDTKKNSTEEVRYINDLSIPVEPISIYSTAEIGKSSIWYKSIGITIGIVDVEEYKPAAPSEHTKISVHNAGSNVELTRGTLIEGSQKVTVTIKPESGYYVTGKKVGNDFYQEKMKYSDYLKKIDSIISSHPALPYYSVTLDASDSYAKYTYKLDGKKVSGKVNVKEGQELELIYEITDSNYELSEASGGFVFGIGSSKTKATEKITIDKSMNGKTITKSDFNIETVKKGG